MIACLGGGIGAARLWRVLAAEVGAENLTIVVNTADDCWQHGLRVCPDLDTVTYWLSDRADTERGWGLRDESFGCMEALGELGEDVWFNLGDRDLATHLLRTGWLREGLGLAEVTARLAARLGTAARILPMSEQMVETKVETSDEGWVHYQDFLVRRRAEVDVESVAWSGIGAARAAPGVLNAIRDAQLVVLGPSNPVASLLPILGVAGVGEALADCEAPVVAVTPVVRGVPIGDPGDAGRARSREKLLATRGVEHSAGCVASLYADLADAFVIDEADAAEQAAVEALGLEVLVAPTLTHLVGQPQRAQLLARLLALARPLASQPVPSR